MDMTCIFFGVAFLIGGLWFGFLGGYKRIDAPKKKSRNVGEVIMMSGLIFLLKGLWVGFSEHYFLTAMIAWFVIAFLDLLKIRN